MPLFARAVATASASTFALLQLSATAQSFTVLSPDRQIQAEVRVAPNLTLTVKAFGKTVIENSPLGLTCNNEPIKQWKVEGSRVSKLDSIWHPVVGRFSSVQYRAQQISIDLVDSASAAHTMQLLVRASNDGVAFRYQLPPTQASGTRMLTAENTAFRFTQDADCWAAPKDPAYETEYPQKRLSALGSSPLTSLPLTIRLGDGLYCAIAEADLVNYPGAYLAGASSTGQRLFTTQVMHADSQPQHISVPITGMDTIALHIGDGGDDFTYDHADWADAKLIALDGTSVLLSSLTPLNASQGFGSLQRNRSVDGNLLTLGSQEFASGLGTHSVGDVVYAVHGKYSRLEAVVGIDAETKGRGSVTFEVFGRKGAPQGAQMLSVAPAPRLDGKGLAIWDANSTIKSPWRVLMIAQQPGDLAQSEIIENLSRPCTLADTSWIKPGMMAWDHWWSGDVKMTTDENLRYLRFAGEMGWQYQLVDWQWYGAFDNVNADITKINPAIDMPSMLREAEKSHIRLWVWLHSNDVNRYLQSGKLEEAFETYHKWGLAGVKIDFMNRDDQEMVEWYETIVKMAAQHRLMVDFHGAFKPTGLRRTYPNLMTREGVLGNEYNKFSNRVTPEHTLILPFTRMLAGPMDFTPGGFHNVTKAAFKQAIPTQVMGSRAHQLAMFVVYDGPLCCFCEDPEYSRGQPGIEFLRSFPTSWDETRVLSGDIGKQIVSARRKGSNWYIGGMCADDPVNIKLKLGFLGKGKYAADIYRDAADSATDPKHIMIEHKIVTSADVFDMSMAAAGGIAVRFSRMGNL